MEEEYRQPTMEELDKLERELSTGWMEIPLEQQLDPMFQEVSEVLMRGQSRIGLNIPKNPTSYCPDLLNYKPPINKK